MRISEILFESTDQPTVAYHITSEQNAKDILKYGLDPNDSYSDDWNARGEKVVYLITDTQDIGEVAMWMDSKFRQIAGRGPDIPITLLKIDISGIPLKIKNGWYATTETISPNRITDLGWRELDRYS